MEGNVLIISREIRLLAGAVSKETIAQCVAAGRPEDAIVALAANLGDGDVLFAGDHLDEIRAAAEVELGLRSQGLLNLLIRDAARALAPRGGATGTPWLLTALAAAVTRSNRRHKGKGTLVVARCSGLDGHLQDGAHVLASGQLDEGLEWAVIVGRPWGRWV